MMRRQRNIADVIIKTPQIMVLGLLFLAVSAYGGGPAFPGNVTSQTGDPDFILEDTDAGETDWAIQGDGPVNESFAVSHNAVGPFNRHPLIIENGAPSNALYIDSSGSVGVGTAAPGRNLHILSNTGTGPAVRFEDNFGTIQTWDLLSTGFGFRVVDVTNGGTPFNIQPGAGTSALYVASAGNVGLGLSTPSAPLHVRRTNTANILVQNTTSTPAQRTLFQLKNAGNTRFGIENTDVNVEWLFLNSAVGTFRISDVENPNTIEFELDQNGNLTTAGTVNGVSDRNAKTHFKILDVEEVLDKVLALPVTEWTYKFDEQTRHIGPVAQDFRAVFGLGEDDRTIALSDLSGVALVAIQGLNAKLEQKERAIDALKKEKDAQINALQIDNVTLANRLAVLEQWVMSQRDLSVAN